VIVRRSSDAMPLFLQPALFKVARRFYPRRMATTLDSPDAVGDAPRTPATGAKYFVTTQ